MSHLHVSFVLALCLLFSSIAFSPLPCYLSSCHVTVLQLHVPRVRHGTTYRCTRQVTTITGRGKRRERDGGEGSGGEGCRAEWQHRTARSLDGSSAQVEHEEHGEQEAIESGS